MKSVLLSSKRTKAYTKTRADDVFALPAFPEATATLRTDLPYESCKKTKMEHSTEANMDSVKQTMLQHESTFKEQLHELHRLYQVQKLLMDQSRNKDSFACAFSCPPSSNTSLVYSSDSYKPGEGHAWVPTTKPKLSFSHIEPPKSEQVSFYLHQIHSSGSQDFMHRPEESICTVSQKVGRRLFDLERPGEEYMDVEAEEEKHVSRLGSTIMESAVISSGPNSGQSTVSGSNTDSNLGRVQAMDKNFNACTEIHKGSIRSPAENTGQVQFLLDRTGGREAPFFLTGAVKVGGGSAQVQGHTSQPLSTKSLLGGLLGLDHENKSGSTGPPWLYTRNTADSGVSRKERQLLDQEPAKHDRSRTYASKAPHWLLQGNSADSMTRLHDQFLPEDSQKYQEKLDLSSKLAFPSGVTGSCSNSLKAGDSWSSNQAFLHQGKTISQGSQSGPYFPIESAAQCFPNMLQHISSMGPEKTSVNVDGNNSSLLPPLLTPGYAPTTTVSMETPVREIISTPTMFLPGLDSGKAHHTSASQSWLQQNSFSSLMPQVSQSDNLCKESTVVSSHDRSIRMLLSNDGQVPKAVNSMENLRGGANEMLVPTDDSVYSKTNCTLDLLSESATLKSTLPPTNLQLMLGPSLVMNGGSESQASDTGSPFDKDHKLPFLQNIKSEKGMGKPFESRHQFLCFTEGSKSESMCKALKEEYRTASPELNLTASMNAAHAGTLHVRQYDLNQVITEVAREEFISSMPSTRNTLLQQANSEKHPLWFMSNSVEEPLTKPKSYDSRDNTMNHSSMDDSAIAASVTHRVFVGEAGVSGADCPPFCRGDADGQPLAGRSSENSVVTGSKRKVTGSLSFVRSRNDSNTSSSEACDSGNPNRIEVPTLSPSEDVNDHVEKNFEDANVHQQHSSTSSTVLKVSGVFEGVTEGHDKDHGDLSKANALMKDVANAFEHTDQVVEILLSLASDSFSESGKRKIAEHAICAEERSLEWFANFIPGDIKCETAPKPIKPTENEAFKRLTLEESKKNISEDVHEKTLVSEELDVFESATLLLKAVSPDTQTLSRKVVQVGQTAGECQAFPNLRRSSRRRRMGRDFQRDVMPSVISVSRQDIAEDLQIIEGLIRSAAEVIEKPASAAVKENECPSKTALGAKKKQGGTKGRVNGVTKSCPVENQRHDILRICSWGESTRRRCLRRQRSRWACLPSGL